MFFSKAYETKSSYLKAFVCETSPKYVTMWGS